MAALDSAMQGLGVRTEESAMITSLILILLGGKLQYLSKTIKLVAESAFEVFVAESAQAVRFLPCCYR